MLWLDMYSVVEPLGSAATGNVPSGVHLNVIHV